MFYTIFPGFIETYITQPGLFQMMSNTQQSMSHVIKVMVDVQQSHQLTTQLQSQRTEKSTVPDA